MPCTARESRHIVPGGGSSVSMKTARSTTEAIGNLRNGLDQGMAIDSSMYVEVLRRCLKEKNLNINVTKQVHKYINHGGMEQNTYVANHLVSVYIKCGELEDARGVFDKLESKNVFSWTIMIGGYAKHNHAEKVMELFNQMCQKGIQPNAFIFSSILTACADPSALQWGKEFHAYVRHTGLESDVQMGNALVYMYGKCGSVVDTRLVFDWMEDHDVIMWTGMIGGLAQHGCGSEAYELFFQMKQEGLEPNAITYVNILNPCSSTGALEWVKEVHRHVFKVGLELDLRVGSVLVHMHAICGFLVDARLVFDGMEDCDVIMSTAMIGGLVEHGCGSEAYELLLQMKQEGLKPNAITYASILNPCSSARALQWVKEVHKHVLKAGLESDLLVGNAFVHMYGKCGSVVDARLVFDRMEDRDVITWTVMIGGLAQQGCGHEALEVFRNMIANGVKSIVISFIAVLLACSHAGLVDEGRTLFLGMTQDYGIESTIVHFTCIVSQ